MDIYKTEIDSTKYAYSVWFIEGESEPRKVYEVREYISDIMREQWIKEMRRSEELEKLKLEEEGISVESEMRGKILIKYEDIRKKKD
ncbi:MAG: hypothetical protein N3G19_01355 [Candidatus Pacearchaeota archaeon]|nr:hypothetical protein [Candidatus Pacearchaeota archaeon]